MGYLGSLSQDPLGRIFSKCVFLNLLNPLGLPIPSNAMEAFKKLSNFPRGCGEVLRAVKERHVSFKSPSRVQDRDKELLGGTEDNFVSLMTDEG